MIYLYISVCWSLLPDLLIPDSGMQNFENQLNIQLQALDGDHLGGTLC